MADVRAIPSIVDVGILSFCEAQRLAVTRYNISNDSVQQKRAKKLIFNNTPLHEYVPLYFGWFTAMQMEIELRSPADSDRLAFVDISLSLLAARAKFVVFSDENAAAERAKFSNNPEDLRWLDWDKIRAAQLSEKPSKKVATKACELLVMRKVPREAITKIVCKTEAAKAGLAFVAKFRPVVVKPSRYFGFKKSRRRTMTIVLSSPLIND